MGNCCGVADETTNHIEQKMKDDNEREKQKQKLLLLGAGGSGKSTLFKQLQYIHLGGFTPTEKIHMRQQIYQQIIECIKILLINCEEYFEEEPDEYKELCLQSDDLKINEAIEYIKKGKNEPEFKKPLTDYLKLIWEYPPIQSMFKLRNEIAIPDSTKYYMDKYNEIIKDDYIPTDKDILLVRTRTTGMQEKEFKIKGHTFKICDVGGQKNERKKWMNFFDNVSAVIFVASLSCYDETVFESDENVMVDSLNVFNKQINNPIFKETPFILFLNKCDVFEQKIKTVPITKAPCFENFTGDPHDSDQVKDLIERSFNDRNRDSKREIYTHVTNATNKENIDKVFLDVQTIVVNASLAKVGLD
mmetsp:Transcript_44307/g.54263  ORF Transcript_44307/g.54263 Transcript_44307/m.54263 type:complete len:360 (+) Transcript_44307:134-1213(+)